MRSLQQLLTRYERRFGYWKMDSDTWRRACVKYGSHSMMSAAYRNDHNLKEI